MIEQIPLGLKKPKFHTYTLIAVTNRERAKNVGTEGGKQRTKLFGYVAYKVQRNYWNEI